MRWMSRRQSSSQMRRRMFEKQSLSGDMGARGVRGDGRGQDRGAQTNREQWGRKKRATYIIMGGYSIVTLNGVCLASGKDHWTGHLGLGAVRNCSSFRRGLKKTTNHC